MPPLPFSTSTTFLQKWKLDIIFLFYREIFISVLCLKIHLKKQNLHASFQKDSKILLRINKIKFLREIVNYLFT